jgi:hypothetical protein
MRVVVVGAGYAGTIAANRLAKKVTAAEITVISPRPDFVERVRLHERIAGTGAAAAPLTSMLREGIATRVSTVDKIGDGQVTLGDGAHLDFDHLFLAVGSTVAPLPGTVAVGAWEGAEEARAALAGLPGGRAVTVIGGGLTGIETVSEIAFLLKSPDFGRLWDQYDVKGNTTGRKTFHHPDAGDVTFGYQTMELAGTGGQRLVAYHAEPGTPAYEAMRLLDADTDDTSSTGAPPRTSRPAPVQDA